jgi:ABC-type uncharacterized transport system permease subunit
MITKITKDQWVKVAKAALYSAISAAIAAVLLFTSENDIVVAGLVITPIINTLLVTVKQLFTVE